MKEVGRRLSPEEEHAWERIRDRIFVSRYEWAGFRAADWDSVLLARGLYMGLDVFQALADSAEGEGDAYWVLMACDIPDLKSVALPWEYEALDRLRCTLWGHADCLWLGESSRWGIYAASEGFCVLGADAGFVDRFAAPLGGREELRGRFLDEVVSIAFGDAERANEILALVGWD